MTRDRTNFHFILYICRMESIRRHTAAFTGHRRYDKSHDEMLRESIATLYADGYRIFLSGMAIGFDMAAAEAVLDFREQHDDVELYCIIPFEGQEQRFSQEQQARFREICSRATKIITLEPDYKPWVYTQRNNYLVRHAAALVCYYTGESGGTQYTVRAAARLGLKITNICPSADKKAPDQSDFGWLFR